ncbi:MAG: methanogenesis marker 2 protein [Candidatus Alkanophagales archaeon]
MRERGDEIDLEHLAASLRDFEGVRRKKPIYDVTRLFGETESPGVIMGFGDDAAVLELDDERYVLLAIDGIWGRLLDADPWWAGYCAVLVNVNDIAAMGGVPVAMVNVTATQSRSVCEELVRGMRDGVRKFGVPMVGGHIHPDTPYDSLDVAIVGVVKKGCVLLSNGARPGDVLVIGIDLHGRVYPKFPLAWDSTTLRSPAEVRRQRRTMVEIGEKCLATAAKDISNPGTIGSVGMLLETSDVGGVVDLRAIPRPRAEGVPLEHWLKMYPGTGFVLSTESESAARRCIEIFEAAGVSAAIVGEVDDSRKLRISNGNDEATVFDFNKDMITGIRKPAGR